MLERVASGGTNSSVRSNFHETGGKKRKKEKRKQNSQSALWSIIHIWRLAPPIAACDLTSMRLGGKENKEGKRKKEKDK